MTSGEISAMAHTLCLVSCVDDGGWLRPLHLQLLPLPAHLLRLGLEIREDFIFSEYKISSVYTRDIYSFNVSKESLIQSIASIIESDIDS